MAMPDPDETLADFIQKAKAKLEAMSPAEQTAMLDAQYLSVVRAEAGMGSDADVAAYRVALKAGDTETLARLDAEAAERMRRVI